MSSKDAKSSLVKTAVTSAAVRDVVDQATQLAKEQGAQAAVLARAAAEKAAPKVGAAVEWASPRLERGLLAAGPTAEAAAEKVAPAVDAARDRIVDDLLPRIVEAVTAAAAASATAQRAAADRVSASLADAAAAVAAPAPSSSHRGRKLLLFGTIAAAGAAGLAAWRRTRATGPQWDTLDADGPAFTGGPEPTPRTLTEPTSSASATVAETVAEEPIADAVPEVPATGDPLLDVLGTAEANGADTGGATDVIPDLGDDVSAESGTGVDEGSAPTVDEGTGDKPAPRRRKQP